KYGGANSTGWTDAGDLCSIDSHPRIQGLTAYPDRSSKPDGWGQADCSGWQSALLGRPLPLLRTPFNDRNLFVVRTHSGSDAARPAPAGSSARKLASQPFPTVLLRAWPQARSLTLVRHF